jgi:hypothetical protein
MRRIALYVALAAFATGAGAGAGACGADTSTALGEHEDCTNGVDDDGDGATDCEDADCHGHAYCLAYHEYTCANGADDDGDGLIDCADPDCQQTQECDPSREWSCHDGVDNDGDGLPDCLDPDCQQACTEVCDDGVDNDGDSLTDCADPDCWAEDGCYAGDEICRNGVDDDGDGLIDCEDPDCADLPACDRVEICNNDGVDDDDDGLADCDDPDCANNPYCLELVCDDSEDNDGNGLVDCDDPMCVGLPGCIPSQSCVPSELLLCGDSIVGSTAGRLDNFNSYPCLPGSFHGGEHYYLIQPVPGQLVTVALNDNSANQDLQLIASTTDDQVGGCNLNDSCLISDQTTTWDQEVVLDVDSVLNLWVIVDSAAAGGGFFDLDVICSAEHELDCTNGLDDDNDGLVDCMDPDCIGTTNCLYSWVDAGVLCQSNTECAPSFDHFCMQPPNNPGMWGFCSRECYNPGTLGGMCDTGDPAMQGYCYPEGGSGGFCVYPCGSAFPGHQCPTNWHCINPANGSTTGVAQGACAPAP